MLKLSHIQKSFDDQMVIEDFTLHLPTGQVFVLIGPSGCGKSTLLKLVAGLLPADSGQIEIEHQVLNAENVQHLRHRLGYVVQEGGLFPHLTIRANITLLARFLNWPEQKIEARINELLAITGISLAQLARYPSELSGGQRQRISLIRALMTDPPLLLLDEPLGALDPMIRADLQQELQSIFKQLQKTVLLVTHDLHEAEFFSDHIVLMHNGKLVQQGSFAELDKNPEFTFVKQFFAAQTRHRGRG